jgi:phosphoribosylaminoimidazole-succinocarboxamide synthase
LLVRKARPLPIECVARGYISGSGWSSYRSSGEVCGIKLPAGLKESDRLAEPIFTPATKEEVGIHDINIDFEEAQKRIGHELAERVRDLTLAIYRKGAAFAETKGILIADTKFEFGLDEAGQLTLIDEVLTPDSSRFWPVDEYRVGANPPSFDKQYVRDWLTASGWNKRPPAPELPPEVVARTAEKYAEALRRLTG